jgi:hypothetical protein
MNDGSRLSRERHAAMGDAPARAPALLRALGVLPLAFTFAYFVVASREGRAADTLWMCHVSNVLLGIGMMFALPALVRVAAAWIVLGFLLWPLDIWTAGGVTAISIVSHAGGLAVALYAVRSVGTSRKSWLPALLLMLFIQQLCRWFTPPELNVNLSQRIYTGFDAWFATYPVYWSAMTALAALGLWAIGRMLSVAFPGPQKQ